MARPFGCFDEFWPFYVSQHLNPINRALHFAGTTLALVSLVAAASVASPVSLLFVPLAGYGPAWVGHFFFERTRPATFQHPLWSLRGDFRMYRLMWARRMREQVAALPPAA